MKTKQKKVNHEGAQRITKGRIPSLFLSFVRLLRLCGKILKPCRLPNQAASGCETAMRD
jgi:hypothetical protein